VRGAVDIRGHWKRALEVNLSTGEHETRGLSEAFVSRYLGGAGFTTKDLYDEVGPETDPLGPENVLAVAPGTLVGPSVPTGSKTAVGFKSPLTGGYGKSLVGAKMGDQLKRAGYDLLVVRGAAAEPSLLVIDDDVRIEPADDLWGMDTYEAGAAIKARHEGVRTAVIGPAGENLSKISMIECEDRQAGRGGSGAVMGSKKLKGIAVTGSKDLPVANPAELKELNHKWRLETTGRGEIEITGTGDASVDVQYGTGEALDVRNTELGIFPTRNWPSSYFEKAYDRLDDPENERIDIDPRKWTQTNVPPQVDADERADQAALSLLHEAVQSVLRGRGHRVRRRRRRRSGVRDPVRARRQRRGRRHRRGREGKRDL
jgi:aldehyde:ferredoxin oxidoreductase